MQFNPEARDSLTDLSISFKDINKSLDQDNRSPSLSYVSNRQSKIHKLTRQ